VDCLAVTGSDGDRDRISQLERENAALRRVNAKLMRERIGSANTAAAADLAAAPRRATGSPLLAPLRRLRLLIRRLVLRVLR
jgi:hypothetical protein